MGSELRAVRKAQRNHSRSCRWQVIAHGRGRGAAGLMGRGRPMPNKQNLRVVECKPQPCVVSVEGLSSSTTDAQLKGLLMSVGPIQVGFPAHTRPTHDPTLLLWAAWCHGDSPGREDRCVTCMRWRSALSPQS